MDARGVKSSSIAYPDSAMVRVEVGPDGRVVQTTVIQSSNDKLTDLAVLQAAQRATYAPATSGCQPASGTVVLYFTNLGALPGVTVQVPDHWCDSAAKIEPVIVAELEVPRATLEKAASNGRALTSGVRVQIGLDGNPIKTSARVYESTGNDDVDGYAIAGALSRSFASAGSACKVANTDAYFIPAFVPTP